LRQDLWFLSEGQAVKGTLKMTALRLLEEFSVPLIISIAWTTYVLWGKEVTVQSVGANFGGAFFFVSWMTGQFFRVRKQAGVENSLLAVERRIQAVTDRLEIQTKEFVGHVTGGSSYCYMQVGRQGGNSTIWFLIHGGGDPYPMYAVSARVVDLDTLKDDIAQGRMNDRTFNVGEVSPGIARPLEQFDLGPADSRSFNVFFTARNGFSTQVIRFRRVNGAWLCATQVENRLGIIVHSNIDNDYPRNEAGDVDWD
jgi:hypothetical protein